MPLVYLKNPSQNWNKFLHSVIWFFSKTQKPFKRFKERKQQPSKSVPEKNYPKAFKNKSSMNKNCNELDIPCGNCFRFSMFYSVLLSFSQFCGMVADGRCIPSNVFLSLIIRTKTFFKMWFYTLFFNKMLGNLSYKQEEYLAISYTPLSLSQIAPKMKNTKFTVGALCKANNDSSHNLLTFFKNKTNGLSVERNIFSTERNIWKELSYQRICQYRQEKC